MDFRNYVLTKIGWVKDAGSEELEPGPLNITSGLVETPISRCYVCYHEEIRHDEYGRYSVCMYRGYDHGDIEDIDCCPMVNKAFEGYCPICGTPEDGNPVCSSCGYLH